MNSQVPIPLSHRLLKAFAMAALTVLAVFLFNVVGRKEQPSAVELEYLSWLARKRVELVGRSVEKGAPFPTIEISVAGTEQLVWSLSSTDKLRDGPRILRLLDLLAEARLAERPEVAGSPVTVRVREGGQQFVYSLTESEVDSNLRLQLFLRLGQEYAVR